MMNPVVNSTIKTKTISGQYDNLLQFNEKCFDSQICQEYSPKIHSEPNLLASNVSNTNLTTALPGRGQKLMIDSQGILDFELSPLSRNRASERQE